MAAFDYDKLAPNAPPAWLAISHLGGVWQGIPCVEEVSDVPFTTDFMNGRQRQLEHGWTFEFVMDDPDKPFVHGYGIAITKPAHLTARKNWFIRYRTLLESHLINPLPTQVFTFSDCQLEDVYGSLRGTPGGPFPWPKGQPQPLCGYCHKRLVFMGQLDFRRFDKVGNLQLPGAALSLHGCANCGPCELKTTALTWLRYGDEIEIVGDPTHPAQVGTPWDSYDFPTVSYHADDICDDRFFLMERSIYFNFTCHAPKIGGHVFWIQSDDTPVDSAGKPMTFIGQFFGTSEVEIGDSGMAYIFFSETTGQTEFLSQCF
jgi:hypothetical protein